MPVKKSTYQANEPVSHAYFVDSGMISVVSVLQDGRSIEVGTIGSEGIAGGVLLMGAKSIPYQCFVQIAGCGFRIDAATLKVEAQRNTLLRDVILRAEAAFLIQSMQSTACNGMHDVSQRCCRWLLISQDRSQSDVLPLTHEFLALMLGVRRASVTDVLNPLQERGWIQNNRGEIKILNREGLESGSCKCYRLIHDQQNFAVA